MDRKAQASFEYLSAVFLAFLLTLVVFSIIFNMVNSAKQSTICKIRACDPVQEKTNGIFSFLGQNALFFLGSVLGLYFAEFFVIFAFLSYICRPKKDKLKQKQSSY